MKTIFLRDNQHAGYYPKASRTYRHSSPSNPSHHYLSRIAFTILRVESYSRLVHTEPEGYSRLVLTVLRVTPALFLRS